MAARLGCVALVILVYACSLAAASTPTEILEARPYCKGNAECVTNMNNILAKGTGPFKAKDELVAFVKISRNNVTRRATFFPRVDEFSLLEVPGSYGAMSGTPPPEAWVEVQGVRVTDFSNAFQTHKWSSDDGKKYALQMTVITSLGAKDINNKPEMGHILSVRWDDFCTGCDTNCVGAPRGFCAGDATTDCKDATKDCPLRVFLGFTGQDSTGHALTSSNKRVSLFRQWGVNLAATKTIELAQALAPLATASQA